MNKKSLVILILVGGSMYAYHEKEKLKSYWEPRSPKISQIVEEIRILPFDSPATPTPKPQTIQEIKAVVSPASPWYYLLTKKSIEKPEGIFGFPPGSLVEAIGDGKYKTRSGEVLILSSSEVTQDSRIAGEAVMADQKNQSSLKSIPEYKEKIEVVPASQTVEATPIPRAASSNPLNSAAHSRTKNGWLWELDSNGNWQKIRPLGH